MQIIIWLQEFIQSSWTLKNSACIGGHSDPRVWNWYTMLCILLKVYAVSWDHLHSALLTLSSIRSFFTNLVYLLDQVNLWMNKVSMLGCACTGVANGWPWHWMTSLPSIFLKLDCILAFLCGPLLYDFPQLLLIYSRPAYFCYNYIHVLYSTQPHVRKWIIHSYGCQ